MAFLFRVADRMVSGGELLSFCFTMYEYYCL